MTDLGNAARRMTHMALRISSSSDARVLSAHFASCVLDLLGHVRARLHGAPGSVI